MRHFESCILKKTAKIGFLVKLYTFEVAARATRILYDLIDPACDPLSEPK